MPSGLFRHLHNGADWSGGGPQDTIANTGKHILQLCTLVLSPASEIDQTASDAEIIVIFKNIKNSYSNIFQNKQ